METVTDATDLDASTVVGWIASALDGIEQSVNPALVRAVDMPADGVARALAAGRDHVRNAVGNALELLDNMSIPQFMRHIAATLR